MRPCTPGGGCHVEEEEEEEEELPSAHSLSLPHALKGLLQTSVQVMLQKMHFG